MKKMLEQKIKTYKGKFYNGDEFKKQGVVDGDASILEIFERAAGNYLIKIKTQTLEDFLNGRLPFSNINSFGLNKKKKKCFYQRIKDYLEYFIGESGYRDIGKFVYLKQFELDNTVKKGYFRWDDMYFTSVYATDKDGYVQMICYYVPEDDWLWEIPENLLFLKRLKILDLPWNYIEKIPDDIGRLKGLKYLNLSGNKLSETASNWCKSIPKLSSLEYLNLSDMGIGTFPYSFGNLTNLKYLNLANNDIETIPDSIKKLENLRFLDISHNNIQNIPNSINSLRNLKKIKY